MFAIKQLRAGFKIIFQPGFRLLALGPIGLNLMLYIALAWFAVDLFSPVLSWVMSHIPGWLGFLEQILWLIFSLLLLVCFGYSFALFATLIASPINGLLAEKTAAHLGKRNFNLTKAGISQAIVQSLWREVIKLGYFLPRILIIALITFLFSFVPIIGLLAPILAFLWASWSMAVQFIDIPADNDGINFKHAMQHIRTFRSDAICFGALVTVLISLPLINLFVLPAAVVGATLLWIEKADQDSTR